MHAGSGEGSFAFIRAESNPAGQLLVGETDEIVDLHGLLESLGHADRAHAVSLAQRSGEVQVARLQVGEEHYQMVVSTR